MIVETYQEALKACLHYGSRLEQNTKYIVSSRYPERRLRLALELAMGLTTPNKKKCIIISKFSTFENLYGDHMSPEDFSSRFILVGSVENLLSLDASEIIGCIDIDCSPEISCSYGKTFSDLPYIKLWPSAEDDPIFLIEKSRGSGYPLEKLISPSH